MAGYNSLVIYTDGSSLPKPRRGGFGIRIIFPEYLNKQNIDLDSPCFLHSTNNEMELRAIVWALEYAEGLEELTSCTQIEVYTDSKYVTEYYQEAMYQWQRNHWLRANGEPVQNANLWKDLKRIRMKIGKRVDIKWVKGHAKDPDNKAVDKIAKLSAKKLIRKRNRIITIGRKKSPLKVDHELNPAGKRLSIYIITAEHLSLQKTDKFKYEVISKKSEYHQQVGIVHGELPMKGRHSYYVSFKKDTKIATRSKVIKEINIRKQNNEAKI